MPFWESVAPDDFVNGVNQAVTKATEAVSSATAIIIPSNSISSNSMKPRNVDKHSSPAYYRELLLSEFEDILVDELPNELPPLREVNHRIPYKPKKPWIAHKYRLSEAHKKALEQEVTVKLQSGILRYTSDVPLAASHMARKHEPSKFQHVQDLHKRNEDMESMAWPLPDQEELLHNVAHSSNASMCNMISAFDQTRIHPDDEKYTTIINHIGIL